MTTEKPQNMPETNNQYQDSVSSGGKTRTVLKLITGALILSAAVTVMVHWLLNKPRAGRRPPEKTAPLVQTKTVEVGTFPFTVHAMGTVIPAEEVAMVARVSGQLDKVNPDLVPGGHMRKGEMLARVEQRDYQLAVEQARAALQQAELTCQEREFAIEQRNSDVAQAEKALKIEQAQCEVARRELELLQNGGDSLQDLALADTGLKALQGIPDSGNPGYDFLDGNISETDKELILRKPQLKAAKASYEAAKAGREQAKVAHKNALAAKEKAGTALKTADLKLEWTTVEVPFNAVVRSKKIGGGSYVSPGNPLATLVNTDRYWVEVSVPVDRLKWIDIPTRNGGKASKARIYHSAAWGKEKHREGVVKRLEPGIESQGRMARLIVEVEDPRCLTDENKDKPVLMLDSYVDVEIDGNPVKDAVKVPRTAVREGDRVWVLSEKGKLDVREINVAATAPDCIYAKEGLQTGDRLITSDIASPVEGMALRESVGNGKASQKATETIQMHTNGDEAGQEA